MAKKKGLLGTLALLGAAAAATAAVYNRREEIRDLLNGAKERFFGSGDETAEETEERTDDEDALVIDITVECEPEKKEEEDGED